MRVVFRIYPNDEVIALFPEEAADRHGNCISCLKDALHYPADYHHVVSQTRRAKPPEYADLLNDLKTAGYRDLVIRNKVALVVHARRQLAAR